MESHSICCLAIWSSPGRAAHSIGWDHSQNGRTAGVGSGDAREQISWSTFFFLSGDCTERRGKMGRFMLFSYLVKILKVRKFRTTSYVDCSNLWKDQCCQAQSWRYFFWGQEGGHRESGGQQAWRGTWDALPAEHHEVPRRLSDEAPMSWCSYNTQRTQLL